MATIKITNDCILRPPCNGLHPHPIRDVVSVPLNIFDKAAGNIHFPVLLAYRNMPSNQDVVAGLSRALEPYPHLAGRISRDAQGRLSFLLNNAGIRLVEANIPVRMSNDNALFEDKANHKNLYPPVTPGTQALFQIQLNRYACGGLVIGSTFYHPVADGQFLQSWASATRGTGTGPPPFLDRNSLFVPNDPPQVKFDHLEVHSNGVSSLPPKSSSSSSSGVENLVIQFSGEFIAQLKKQVSFRTTTFEVLLAHIWRRTIQVRGLPDDEVTRVRVAVNGRTRMRPVVPPEYFSNLVLWALAKASAGELARKGLSGAVGHVRKAVARMDDEYFRFAIDFGAMLEKEGGEDDSLMGDEEDWAHKLYPDLEVDSWLGFRFNEADFGQGPPCAVVLPNLPIEGVMAFISSAKLGKGGVDAFLTLRKEHVDDFKKIYRMLD